MNIISIVNQKGGTGKTTTAINLGASLVKLGKKILLIDADPQANLTTGIGIKDKDKTIYDCLVNDAPIKECIYKTGIENLYIIPSSIQLANAEIELSSVLGRESVLKDAVCSSSLDYDYILIDCNPSLGLLTVNALTVCDNVLIPLEPSIFSFQGVDNLIKIINLIQKKLNSKINILGVLLTRVDSRTNISKNFESQLKEIFKNKVFDTLIHQNVKIVEAQVEKKTIIEYDKQSKGAKEYLQLAKEVVKRG